VINELKPIISQRSFWAEILNTWKYPVGQNVYVVATIYYKRNHYPLK